MPDDRNTLLQVDSLATGYGKKPVLFGVSLDVSSEEIVAVIGPNGAGKSTLLKAIFGLLKIWKGRVYLDGRALDPQARDLQNAGVAYVPQGSRVFTDLSVRENLEMGGITLQNRKLLRERIEWVLSLFPTLGPQLARRAGVLSGGEKQLLALARAFVMAPRLLLLDEPSLGLSPTLVSRTFSQIEALQKDHRVALIIVEQKVREVLRVSRRAFVLRNGMLAYSGLATALDESRLQQLFLCDGAPASA